MMMASGCSSAEMESALTALSPWLQRVTRRRLGTRDAADDAAQETLRRALTALRSGRIEKPASLRSFLVSTAEHVCYHYIRSRQRERRAFARLEAPTDRAGSVLLRLVSEQRIAALRSEVRRLEPSDRELLHHLFVDELRPAGLAAATGVDAATLRVRKHRLLRLLRRRLLAT